MESTARSSNHQVFLALGVGCLPLARQGQGQLRRRDQRRMLTLVTVRTKCFTEKILCGDIMYDYLRTVHWVRIAPYLSLAPPGWSARWRQLLRWSGIRPRLTRMLKSTLTLSIVMRYEGMYKLRFPSLLLLFGAYVFVRVMFLFYSRTRPPVWTTGKWLPLVHNFHPENFTLLHPHMMKPFFMRNAYLAILRAKPQ